jgi:hypothetical protein
VIPEPKLPEPQPDGDGEEFVEPVPPAPSGTHTVVIPITAGSAGAAHKE